MNDIAMYFWDAEKQQVIKHYERLAPAQAAIDAGFERMHCVDQYTDEEHDRTGYYFRLNGVGRWHHVSITEFPPEFRAALLLMGIN